MDNQPLCTGSGTFPNNFDGEFTRCDECRRKLNLDPQGLLPRHRPTPAKGFVNASEQFIAFRDRIGNQADE